jgi:hypothetical protein
LWYADHGTGAGSVGGRADGDQIKTRARSLAQQRTPRWFSTGQYGIWDDLDAIFQAIDRGCSEWGVPLYNGGLFGADPVTNPTGAALALG